MSQRDTRIIGGVYRMGQVITSGGMLTTCIAHNRNTNDVVGLTLIDIPPYVEAQKIEMLLSPLERRRMIHSPHVLQVFNWGMDGSRLYIATDPPRGVMLRYMLDNENVDFARALDIMRQLASGVKVLHEQGISELDLRPQLITVDAILVEERVQIDDIGLRMMLRGLGYAPNERPDDIGFLDPRYTSPESISGGVVGPWSDTYQLGLLFFEMVTGRLPFVGRNPAETGVMQNAAPVPRMAQLKHDTPPLFQEIVDKALAKSPADRYTSADALLATLETARKSLGRGMADARPDDGPTTRPGMTREMLQIERDIALVSTVVDPPRPTPPQGDALAYLSFEQDDKETQRFPLTKNDVIVGRLDPKRGISPDIDLSAVDSHMTVSRQHARIRYEGTFFYIEDLKSHNKTRLGELPLTPLKPELLQHGDVVRFGAVRLVFKVPGLPDVAPIKDRKE